MGFLFPLPPLTKVLLYVNFYMISEEDKFKEYLESKNLKFTAERQAILDCIFSSHKHFEAE